MITGDSTFHTTNEKYLRYRKNNLKESLSLGRITESDADLITSFLDELRGMYHIGLGRVNKLQYILVGWRAYLPPFNECDTHAVFSGIEAHKLALKPDGTPLYRTVTQSDYIKALIRFFLWMAENDKAAPGLNPVKLSKIKTPGYKTTKTAEMMLNPEEISRLIESATNIRDKCIISLLYESAMRVGEVGTLKWNQVKFSERTATLNTDEKTGKGRLIPVVYSVEYLKAWLNQYPGGQPGPDNYVFVNYQTREPLHYRAYSKMLEKAAERAGVRKKFTPHSLRHSRITHLLRSGLSESAIKLMAWGSLSSDMLSTYAHLTNEDLENQYCELLGIVKVDKQEDKALEPRQCPKPGCGTICPASYQFCPRCGQPLTTEALSEHDQVKAYLDKLIKENPEKLLRALKEED